LESARRENGKLIAQTGSTDIFIHPPYRFQHIDLLFTNFHLPKSTLLMLVSAFASREFIFRAYDEAIRKHYRFYSYGDCMLIL
jgi:S-adenosylmethionine:tRNA ribosyltransferase-isomerase